MSDVVNKCSKCGSTNTECQFVIRNLVEVTKDTIKDAYQAGGELIPSVKHLFGAMIGAATSPVTVVLEESHYQIEVAIAEVFKAKFQVLFQKKTWR